MMFIKKELFPDLQKIYEMVGAEVLKIDGLPNQNNVAGTLALSILNKLIDGDNRYACAVAQRVLEMAPHNDEFVHHAQMGMLEEGFAESVQSQKDILQEFSSDLSVVANIHKKSSH